MMSGHGGNPIFFNKTIKIGRPEHSLTSHPPTSNNISFFPYPPQSGRHICITPFIELTQGNSYQLYLASFSDSGILCFFPLSYNGNN